MSKQSNSGSSSGVGFTSLLQLMLIGLKLAKVIDWSWVWVLTPTLASILIFAFFAVLFFSD